MREAFEAALKDNPYDQTTRLVFADWLSEEGFDEEAEFHRLWTPQWQQAKDYLEDFARKSKEEMEAYWNVGGLFQAETLEDLLVAVKSYLDGGSQVCFGGGLGYKADELLTDWDDDEGKLVKEFWKHYENYTRTEVSQDKSWGSPFKCCPW